MATSLENQYIDESYQKLVQLSGSVIADGTGSAISSLDITASHAQNVTSASYAVTASYALNVTPHESASYAVSASHAENADNAGVAYIATSSISASRATSAASADTSTSASYAATASILIGSVESASFASTSTSASFATNANTASFLLGSVESASYAPTNVNDANTYTAIQTFNATTTFNNTTTFDGALNQDASLASNYFEGTVDFRNDTTFTGSVDINGAVTATSFSGDGSSVTGVISASHAVQADSSLTADSATSSSYASTATSASHAVNSDLAITASYAKSVDATSITGSVEFAEYANNTIVYGKNLSGGVIAKGTPLYFTGSGTSGNLVGVYPADASNPARMPAGGIAGEQLAIAAEGRVLLDGFINGVDTSAFASGDQVWVAVGGGYTNQRPTGSSTLIQPLGYVEKSAINGSGVINGPGIERAMPNITTNYLWLGNSDGVATAVNSASLKVTNADSASYADGYAKLSADNIFTGTQTFDNIAVNGTGSFAYLQQITGSAKVIGDAFLILNADSPSQRYAGLSVYDSGSVPIATSSFWWDGVTNDWKYQYSSSATHEAAVALFGPEMTDISGALYPSANTILKGNGDHHVTDSNLLDNGSKIYSDLPFSSSAGFTGSLHGNADTATSATSADSVAFANITGKPTLVSGSAQIDLSQATGTAANATSASHAVQADSSLTSDLATTASYVAGANVDGTVASATSASYVAAANVHGTVANATSSSYAITASFAENAGQSEGVNTSGDLKFENSIAEVYGSETSPVTTSTLTISTTSTPIVGASAIVFHSASAEPTIATGSYSISKKSGLYSDGELNIITFVYLGNNDFVQTTLGTTSGYITNTADTYTTSPKVDNIVTLTQAEYNSISASADVNTLYITI